MRIPLLIGAGLALACSGRGAPVAVEGPAPDRAMLAGEWAGEFRGENGRVGSVWFALTEHGDSAFGDIQMVPEDPAPVVPGREGRPTLAPTPLILSIRFVRIAGDRVRGVLDVYRDPVCGCRVVTTFEGTLRGDAIVGDYRTRHTEHAREVHGTWRVTRRPVR